MGEVSTRRIRRMKLRHDGPLNFAEAYHLATGIGGAYVDVFGDRCVAGFEDEAAAREAWASHADEFEVHPEPVVYAMYNVGTRPWAWWRFDSGRPELAEGPWHPVPRSTGDRLRFDYSGGPTARFRFLAESGELTPAEVAVSYEAEQRALAGKWPDEDRDEKCWRAAVLRAAGVPSPLEETNP